MKTIWRLVFVLTGALALCGSAETNAVKTFVLKGTVVDAAGRPMADATVETYTYGRYTSGMGMRLGRWDLELGERAVADADGHFELRLPRAGALVLARRPDLAPAWRQFWNLKADLEQRFVLTPPAMLGGTVVDEANKPVVNAEVFVLSAKTETVREDGSRRFNWLVGKPARELFGARTANDGRFHIEGIPTNASANLWVRASRKVFRQSLPGSFDPDAMQGRAGQDDIRLVVEPAGSIEGKIIAEDAGQPLPTATLTLEPDPAGFSV